MRTRGYHLAVAAVASDLVVAALAPAGLLRFMCLWCLIGSCFWFVKDWPRLLAYFGQQRGPD